MDFCQQNDVSAFKYVVYVGHSFPCKEQASIFYFHGCIHCPQWFWSPRQGFFHGVPNQVIPLYWHWHQKFLRPAVVQSLSHVQLLETPWTPAHQASLSFTISWSLLRLKSVESVMPSNHLILCHPLLLLPSIFPRIRVFPVNWFFTSGGQSIGAPVSASVLPMNIQGWFPLGRTGLIFLQPKGLSRLLQHHNLKASILQHSIFFMVQLSYPYVTIGKTIALIIQTFVRKVLSLLFNTLSRLVMAFLPRSKFCNCSHHLQWFWRLRK